MGTGVHHTQFTGIRVTSDCSDPGCTRTGTPVVETIDHETLDLFLASPAARVRPDHKAKKATSAGALRTSLRTFFRRCHDGEYTRSNPARLIRRALCG